MIEVYMNDMQLLYAQQEAEARHGYHSRGLKDKLISNNVKHSRYIGVLGEMAVRKALGYGIGVEHNNFKDPDVGPMHVRTRRAPGMGLLLREDDPEFNGRGRWKKPAPWVLVNMEPYPNWMTIRGWGYKHEVCIDRYWGDPGGYGKPCWEVPESALHPAESLMLLFTKGHTHDPRRRREPGL